MMTLGGLGCINKVDVCHVQVEVVRFTAQIPVVSCDQQSSMSEGKHSNHQVTDGQAGRLYFWQQSSWSSMSLYGASAC
jgi:hypothetical protein